MRPLPCFNPEPQEDIRELSDRLRTHDTVAITPTGEYVVLGHAEVVAAACDDHRFSSQVSRFLQLPNGLDGSEHDQFRALIEHYLTPEAIQPFVPAFTHIADELVQSLIVQEEVDAVSQLGAVFAVRAQCAWLGWPIELESTLLNWVRANNRAAQSDNVQQKVKVAEEFDAMIQAIVRPRRQEFEQDPTHQPADVTDQLCADTQIGRLLTEAELTSILRNWTGGDLSSMALCIGVVIAYLLQHPRSFTLWQQLSDEELEAHINEVLRLDNPFVWNRRITRCPVQVGEHVLLAGQRVYLNWTSANRDERVFTANQYAPQAHANHNLVYGIGRHICPGRTLATWQLRILIRILLTHCKSIQAGNEPALKRAQPPLGGYNYVSVRLVGTN